MTLQETLKPQRELPPRGSWRGPLLCSYSSALIGRGCNAGAPFLGDPSTAGVWITILWAKTSVRPLKDVSGTQATAKQIKNINKTRTNKNKKVAKRCIAHC